MPLKIYNTLTREKESFVPLESGKVKMYVCGVTVYDSCHVGHARAAVVFDCVYRFLRSLGLEVKYVRNFTDIDDKIIKRVQELKVNYRTLTEKYIQEYLDEMRLLNVLDPTLQPRATEHIQDMIQMIEDLIEKKYAYAVGGDVYFEVSKFSGYGKLSRRSLDEMKASRISPDERKLHPEDFALWKSAKPNEPSWPSPWGEGRPGWHIECSSMGVKHLGDSFDIHGGGSDLIFPHHENEIAQSECSTGKPFSRYWIHNEMIMIDHTKMSKSLGNVFVLRELMKECPAQVIRFFIISKHYRSPMDFSLEALKEAAQAFERIEMAMARAQEYMNGSWESFKNGTFLEALEGSNELIQFKEALEDDFNTPKSLGILFQVLGELNQALDRKAKRDRVSTLYRSAGWMLDLLGLNPDLKRFRKIKEALPFEEEKVRSLLNEALWKDEDVEYLVKAREHARHQKLWALADQIREAFKERGFGIQDEKDGAKVLRRNG
ncbi:MAG: cysteine--tRNA ligase [Chlamydiae bacterium]|nr:cysteine--tRNA ligase [Chlamydiota bacterium]MBI3265905.1 cysteine--tRNA ligase [Chlamydiota bacterium]